MFGLLMLVTVGAAAIVAVKESAAKRDRDAKRVPIRSSERNLPGIRRRRR